VAMVIGLSLAGGSVWAAEGQVFDVQEQVKKGDHRTRFTLQELVKTPNYTVGLSPSREKSRCIGMRMATTTCIS
jgi:hypothetical protein